MNGDDEVEDEVEEKMSNRSLVEILPVWPLLPHCLSPSAAGAAAAASAPPPSPAWLSGSVGETVLSGLALSRPRLRLL